MSPVWFGGDEGDELNRVVRAARIASLRRQASLDDISSRILAPTTLPALLTVIITVTSPLL